MCPICASIHSMTGVWYSKSLAYNWGHFLIKRWKHPGSGFMNFDNLFHCVMTNDDWKRGSERQKIQLQTSSTAIVLEIVSKLPSAQLILETDKFPIFHVRCDCQQHKAGALWHLTCSRIVPHYQYPCKALTRMRLSTTVISPMRTWKQSKATSNAHFEAKAKVWYSTIMYLFQWSVHMQDSIMYS